MARFDTTRRHGIKALALLLGCLSAAAHAAEHITLRNGFELDCVRREVVGDKVRLYFQTPAGSPENYMEVSAGSVLHIESLPDASPPPASVVLKPAAGSPVQPTPLELTGMLSHAGAQHNVDADLLASLVNAESGGQAHAVSRTGARGLMQLMPGTAAALGVADAFVPAQNVEGGTRYLDQLLTRYHDNIALALAAYNAGPGAVDRFHGIPPYRETRAYVARVIREFNRRKTALLPQKQAAEKLLAQNQKPLGQNQKLFAQNEKLLAQNEKPLAQNQKPLAQNQTPAPKP